MCRGSRFSRFEGLFVVCWRVCDDDVIRAHPGWACLWLGKCIFAFFCVLAELSMGVSECFRLSAHYK